MENQILTTLLALWTFYWQEQGFFRTTENYYCKKNKGDCTKCKAWSCRKGYYNSRKEKENGKENFVSRSK